MNEVVLAAIFGGMGTIIGTAGKVIVDVIKAKKEPDENDIKLKAEVDHQKEEFKQSLHALSKEVKQGFSDIKKQMGEIRKQNESMQKNQETSLRHSITEVYYKYKDKKKFPNNVKQDICFLFAAYERLNGNSYVHEIYEEMMQWDTD